MSEVKRNHFKTLDIALIPMFAAIIAVCSWISIPGPVPFTMQTFGVFLAMGTLGGKRGTISVLIYLLLGAIGAPVFAGFTGGIGKLCGSTGGYIIGFLGSALIVWGMEALLGRKNWIKVLSMTLGLIICYTFGTIWFIIVYTNNNGDIGLWSALTMCVIPYIIPDAIKIALAFIVSARLSKYIEKK